MLSRAFRRTSCLLLKTWTKLLALALDSLLHFLLCTKSKALQLRSHEEDDGMAASTLIATRLRSGAPLHADMPFHMNQYICRMQRCKLLRAKMLPKKRCAVSKAAAKESYKLKCSLSQRQNRGNSKVLSRKCHPPLPRWKISCLCPHNWVSKNALLVDVVGVGHLSVCNLTGIRQQLAQHGVKAKHDFISILVLVLVGLRVQCLGQRTKSVKSRKQPLLPALSAAQAVPARGTGTGTNGTERRTGGSGTAYCAT